MIEASGTDYEFLFEVFHFAFDTAVALYVYLANKNKATNERIDRITRSVDERFGAHSDRLARLEEAAEFLPTHDDLGDLHTRINSMSDNVSSMAGEMKGMRNTLQLIQQHLMKGSAQS